jgi:Peptidase family M1 domain
VAASVRSPGSKAARGAWRWSQLAACAALVACPATAAGATPAVAEGSTSIATARADYERLQSWRYESSPRELPPEGTAWEWDVVLLRLDSGHLRLQEPTSDGTVTGLVFEGEGVLRLRVPDRVELAQLRRFAQDPQLETLEAHFRELVLRSSEVGPLAALAGPLAARAGPLAARAGGSLVGNGPWEREPLAADRHDAWLRLYQADADAAVLSALRNAGQIYLRADLKSEEYGWLTLEIDPRRSEELQLLRFHPGESFVESWLSLDRDGEDREEGDRDGGAAALDVEHVDIEARLVKRGKDASFSVSGVRGFPTVLAEITARVRLRCHRDGQRALQLQLNPWADVSSVRDAGGSELAFLRDHIGGRSHGIDKRIYDASLVVLLDEPLAAGDATEVAVSYEMEVDNYMPGRSWYPGVEGPTGGLDDLHTAVIRATLRDDYEARGMGERIEESEGKGERHLTWKIDKPQKMVSFVFNRKVEEWRSEEPGLPEIVVFSGPLGHSTEGRMSEIGADVTGSVAFFQKLLDAELPVERLTAALTQAYHGQAFDGFLHLSEFSALRHRTGPMEVFLSHEVAHQWWGQMVGWKGYRDQWLSEGLAEYSALLYMQATVPGGDKLFHEALAALGDEVLGSIQSMMSPFARPEMALDNLRALDRIGPIAHGYRAATGEAKGAYLTLAYHKAALVVHMLRVLARFAPGGEDAFVEALRDFVRTYRGGVADTRDFQAAIERHLPGSWDWFFDEWLFRAAIPEYKWSSSVAPGASSSEWTVTLEIEQSGVPEDFRMPVPVRVLFGDGSEASYLVNVDAPRVRREIVVPSRPRKVLFNPDREILAKM